MKKYRFIGDPFNKHGFKIGKTYPNEFRHIAKVDVDSWEEVTEMEIKPLRKDTDLGYFVGLYIQLQGNEHANPDIEWAIRQAKKLIEQLDNENETT